MLWRYERDVINVGENICLHVRVDLVLMEKAPSDRRNEANDGERWIDRSKGVCPLSNKALTKCRTFAGKIRGRHRHIPVSNVLPSGA